MNFDIGDLVTYDPAFHPSGVGIVIQINHEYDVDGYFWNTILVMTPSGGEILFDEDEIDAVESR
ncbi:MAG TPA: hypothetical protein DHN29_20775 [Cytophagales bacterium]|nr:hypothetical protein [Cytophagales bacterium]|tara:strand:+ start:170 stop:361 length:192 start_codon:yes stop_codon:yes gene_type:complete